MLFLLLACSDYNFKETSPQNTASETIEEPEPENLPLPENPEIRVSSLSLTPQGICESLAVDVSIYNDGDAPLIISALEVYALGWSLLEQDLPLHIEPGGTKTIWLQATEGEGVLLIKSNDMDTPEVTVELTAEADQPPELLVSSPQDGAVIPVEGEIFSLIASDAEDPAEEITVEWHSDIDGLLTSTLPASDGSIEFDFSNYSPGPHEITVLLRDTCGNETTATFAICQQQGYDVESLDISLWNFEGTAFWDTANSWVELTGPYTAQAGTAFSTAAAVNAENVEIEFLFFVSGGSGADGISLTALDTTRMSGFVGSSGGGIGYAGMPGWSIEVDTYYNGSDPTPSDHLAFSFDGNVQSPAIWVALPEMEDGQWHSMRVVVTAPHVLVQIDNVTYIDQVISGHYSFPAYVGFTAATGSLTNYHLIDSLMVTEMVCEE